MIELVSHCSKTKSVSCDNSKMSFLVLHKNRFYHYSDKVQNYFLIQERLENQSC